MKKLLLTMCAMGVFAMPSFAVITSGGFIYDDSTIPGFWSNQAKTSPKTGTATCLNVWYIVQTGECGLNDAMKNGGVKQLHHYDVQTKNIIGIAKKTLVVYGE